MITDQISAKDADIVIVGLAVACLALKRDSGEPGEAHPDGLPELGGQTRSQTRHLTLTMG